MWAISMCVKAFVDNFGEGLTQVQVSNCGKPVCPDLTLLTLLKSADACVPELYATRAWYYAFTLGTWFVESVIVYI